MIGKLYEPLEKISMTTLLELIDEDRLIELTNTLVSIPSVTNMEHEISDWIYARATVDLILGRSVADTNHFVVHGGVPAIICGPSGGNTCEANEYVDLSSLPVIARTYVRSVIDLLGS